MRKLMLGCSLMLLAGCADAGPDFRGRRVHDWLEIVFGKDVQARAEAAEELRKDGPAAVEAFFAAATQQATKNSGSGDWERTARILGLTGPEAVPALITRLQYFSPEDPSAPWIRWTAATALGEMGPDAVKAVPALVQALQDPGYRTVNYGTGGIPNGNFSVREAAARALVRVGPAALPALLTAAQENKPVIRRLVTKTMARIKSDADAKTDVP